MSKPIFWEIIKKKIINNLSSAEFAQRVVKVNAVFLLSLDRDQFFFHQGLVIIEVLELFIQL